jgi:hypothetical protein
MPRQNGICQPISESRLCRGKSRESETRSLELTSVLRKLQKNRWCHQGIPKLRPKSSQLVP